MIKAQRDRMMGITGPFRIMTSTLRFRKRQSLSARSNPREVHCKIIDATLKNIRRIEHDDEEKFKNAVENL